MFKNLFGKSEKTEVQIIEEIHNAFDSTQDALLKEAELILSKPIAKQDLSIIDKAERLEKLGFVNVPDVHKASTAREKLRIEHQKKEMSQALAEQIRYYKQTYPFLKFLPVDEMDAICEKYGLIHAPVKAYKGGVPDKNLVEIENAQYLKECDTCRNKFFFIVTKQYADNYTHPEVKKFLGLNDDGIETPREIYGESQLKDFLRGKVSDAALANSRYMYDRGTSKVIRMDGLFICAPKKEFDLSQVEKNQKGYHTVTTKELKDPIVFRYVKGGIQVLSKWGLEASDPGLVNAIDN